MKKIMFNDRYGLTEAVLTGRKTMTRRIVKGPRRFKGCEDTCLEFHKRPNSDIWYDCVVCDADGHELGQLLLPFKVGDVVAVAQSYKDIPMDFLLSYLDDPRKHYFEQQFIRQSAGWQNKLFTLPEKMPHRIRITDLWFERLQDISDEDAMREGIRQSVVEYGDKKIVQWTYFEEKITTWFDSPRAAFAALIDRISGRGTWQSNPWVVAYEFELINKEG